MKVQVDEMKVIADFGCTAYMKIFDVFQIPFKSIAVQSSQIHGAFGLLEYGHTST